MVPTTPKPLYDPCGGHLALDLVNTVDRTVGAPGVERLWSYRDLVRWSVLAGRLPAGSAQALEQAASVRPAEAIAVLVRARALREAAFRTFEALALEGAPSSADLASINAELSTALAHARVEPVEGGFAWAWDRPEGSIEAPLWPVSRATAELLTSPDRAHVRQCAGATCLWLFLDRTRNHARRWCEMKTCGNRAKVRKHRLKTRPKRP